MFLGRKRNWFEEVKGGSIVLEAYYGCFAMLDGQMALISSPGLDYISIVNLQQLNVIENNTEDKDNQVSSNDKFHSIISLDGSIVYQINRNSRRDNSKLSVIRCQTNGCCNIIVSSYVSSFVPMKNGVLLLRENKIPELWNPHLSKCLDYFPQLVGTTRIFPISEDLVACRAKSKVDILNIINRSIVSTSSIPERSAVVACNSKREVLIYNELTKVLGLRKNSAILWQCSDRRFCYFVVCSRAFFSPEGDKIIVFTFLSKQLHILDASTGTYLRCHLLKDVHGIVDCCFLSVNFNKFLICACENNFLYLINVLPVSC